MKKYRFTLERVLRLRKHHELEWELKLAAATGRCIALQNELKLIGRERGRTLSTRFTVSGGDVNQLLRSELYLRRLSKEAEAKGKQLAQREHERAEVRDQYLLASRDRKVLDRLKEKREQEHYRAELIEEVKSVDDLTGARTAAGVGAAVDIGGRAAAAGNAAVGRRSVTPVGQRAAAPVGQRAAAGENAAATGGPGPAGRVG